jgi:hypothetical protein
VHVPCSLHRHNRSGAGPASTVRPLAPPMPDWLLAGLADVDPADAPPPPMWCRMHGWVVCPLHDYGPHLHLGGGDGAGPSGSQAEPPTLPVMPAAHPPPAWLLAGPAAPSLHTDEEMDPELAAPLPPLPCPVHGWACPRLAEHGVHVEEVAPAATSPPRGLRRPSPTPACEPSRAGPEPRLHAPVTSAGDVFGNGAGSSTAAAPPPPCRFRFIEPRAILEASRTGRRPGETSPTNFLPNGHSNGVAPGALFSGESSSEEDGGALGTLSAHR